MPMQEDLETLIRRIVNYEWIGSVQFKRYKHSIQGLAASYRPISKRKNTIVLDLWVLSFSTVNYLTTY